MKQNILCLHGYSMNGHWLKDWLAPLENTLGPGYTFHYPDAPHTPPIEEIHKVWRMLGANIPKHRLGDGLNHCWFRASHEQPPRYDGVEVSLDLLKKLSEDISGFDGIIGWSQGAILASIALSQQTLKPSWAMLGGGALARDPTYAQALTGHKLTLPSVHLLGNLEPAKAKQSAKRLAACFVNPTVIENQIDHQLPLGIPGQTQLISDWIRQHSERNQYHADK